ncbi:unnamed protein product [Orchesella dallaii]|uniref:Uncharacterized protein n=1 Tax=Orchesella dallaii TaxID=48710 RepID=A0ABP1R8Z2_9HEXA
MTAHLVVVGSVSLRNAPAYRIEHCNDIHDTKIWGDPENFLPEKFFNEDESRVIQSNAFVAFQPGKRQCLGESLVRDVLFLYIAKIFQNLETFPDPLNPVPNGWVFKASLWGSIFRKKDFSRLPAGPRSLPLLGNMLDLKRNGHLKLSEWAEQYGPLFTVRIGMKPALVVNDAKLMKELFGHSAATGKFKTDTILELTKGPYGVVSTEGEQWQEQRQFLIRTLVNFGFGKPTMESLILADVQDAIDWMKKDMSEHGTVDVFDVYKCGVTNALWCIVSGERQSKGDQTFSLLIDAFVEYETKPF